MLLEFAVRTLPNASRMLLGLLFPVTWGSKAKYGIFSQPHISVPKLNAAQAPSYAIDLGHIRENRRDSFGSLTHLAPEIKLLHQLDFIP